MSHTMNRDRPMIWLAFGEGAHGEIRTIQGPCFDSRNDPGDFNAGADGETMTSVRYHSPMGEPYCAKDHQDRTRRTAAQRATEDDVMTIVDHRPSHKAGEIGMSIDRDGTLGTARDSGGPV